MSYWLLKADPDDYGFADLENQGTTVWDGVRNYQARNFIREMREGERALVYHSGKERAVVGLATVNSSPYPDPSQFDPESHYYDVLPTQW